MSINEYITDKAIEILGLMDQLLRLARTSLNKSEKEKINEILGRVNSISTDLKEEIAKLDK